MTYTVYEYGIKRILAGEEYLRGQLYERHRYWNSLVEAEKRFRQEIDVLRDLSFEACAADTHDLIYEACDGDDGWFESEVQADEAQARIEAHVQAEMKSDEAKAIIQGANQRRKEVVREARHQTGLYWGSYLDVEGSYRAQRRTRGRQLKFHRAVPEGAISVWPSNGGKNLPITAIWGQDSMVQLEPPAEANPRGRRGNSRTTGRLRAGTEARQPLYVEFQVTLHRPLPATGILRHASIVRRRVASRYEHTLVITVEIPEAEAAAKAEMVRSSERPVAGIDIGWRLFPEHVRIGYLADSLGHVEELYIARRFLGALEKCDDMKSIRDLQFNGVRAEMAAFRRATGDRCPAWFLEATMNLSQWRSQGRLAALALRWRDNRFSGDQVIYPWVEAWRVRDKHLWEYEANLRNKAIRHRRECYRRLAAQLIARYGVVVLEEFDLADMAQKEDTPQRASRTRARAAAGEFRRILETTAAREGVVVQRVPAAYTTLTCHRCESVCAFDAQAELSHLCEWCGAHWDQDENAARNLLRAGQQ